MDPVNSSNIGRPSIVSVIHINVKRGQGTYEDPMRVVAQYFSQDGEFLAEHDPVNEKDNAKADDEDDDE